MCPSTLCFMVRCVLVCLKFVFVKFKVIIYYLEAKVLLCTN